MSRSPQDAQSRQEQKESAQHKEPSTPEWIIGSLSMLLVLTGLGFLVYEAWSGTSLPPMVTVRVDRTIETPTGHVVEVTAANSGGTTARSVMIEGRLLEPASGAGGSVQSGLKVVEKSSTTLQWVPAHAERGGGLFFSRNPADYELRVRPLGYDKP